jgi:RNA polymerase-associated protein CTR9
MAITMNGLANGHSAQSTAMVNKRFSDIPSAVDIPVSGGEIDEVVELELEELPDDPTELCTLLENEKASKNLWMTTSLAYAKQHKIDLAVDILQRGLQTLSQGGPKEKIGLLSLQCWLHLWQSREAPRVAPEGITSEDKTKESCLEQATHALNNALRVDPSFPPLFLARGIHSLLRASLQTFPTANASVAPAQPSRADNLRQAQKWFEHASRLSHHRNMLAILGKARSAYALGRYPEALECYQDVLSKMPDLTDPDPRIGIGCCLWQLGFIEEAREAWERALEMVSKVFARLPATMLMT